MLTKTFRFRREWYDYVEVEAATIEEADEEAARSDVSMSELNFDSQNLIEVVDNE